MISITDRIHIGNSWDESLMVVGSILNVAQDLQSTRGWMSGVEYMQIGLIDGPGNPIYAYYSALIALHVLLDRRKTVLVCCHGGGRALAVAIMYLHLHSRRGWDGCFDVIKERVEVELPEVHKAHRDAFDKMDWKALDRMVSQ